ncbi:MAG: hypothetical protein JXR76_25260 [Deltaproteobacteria bacterium]|nr:hypothetical protein [Deltaproteobacteria bacterium]
MLASRALRTWHICVLIALGMFACSPANDTQLESAGGLFPSSGYQNSEIAVEFVSVGAGFHQCASLVGWDREPVQKVASRFSFFSDNEPVSAKKIYISGIKQVTASQMTLRFQIGGDAPAGALALQFSCDSRHIISADFSIKRRAEKYELKFEPGFVNAASPNARVSVKLVSDGKIKIPTTGPTSVMFENNDHMHYKSWDPKDAVATLSVGDLALEIGKKTDEVNTVFVFGSEVYRQKLEIRPDVRATVTMTPFQFKKPLAGEAKHEFDVTLKAEKNIQFRPEPDEVDTESPWLSVSVPENPGVQISCPDMSDNAEQVTCHLTVDNSAMLGPAAIKIQTRRVDTLTYAAINITPSDYSDSVIRFRPAMINDCVLDVNSESVPDGCPTQLVIANLIGDTVDDTWTIKSLTTGADVLDYQPLGDDHWALWIYPGENNNIDNVELQFTSGNREVRGHLLVRHIQGNAMMRWGSYLNSSDSMTVKQGDSALTRNVYRQSGSFKNGVSEGQIKVSSRNGISLKGLGAVSKPASTMEPFDGTSGYEGITINECRVLDDAPTGPTLMNIEKGSLVDSSIWFSVKKGDQTDYVVSASPNVIWLESPTLEIILFSEGFTVDADTQIAVSDPAIRIESVAVEDENRLRLSLRISPTAKAGLKTFYVTDVDDTGGSISVRKAAVNVRGELPQPVFSLPEDKREIYRSAGQGKIRILVGEAFHNKPFAMSVFNGIGISIERYYTLYEEQNYYLTIVFSLDETGPGGWIGVLVATRGDQFVIPLKIVSKNSDGEEDDSLTVQLNSVNVAPGAHNVSGLTIAMPEVLAGATNGPVLGRLVSQIRAANKEVFARIDNFPIEAGDSAQLSADFSYFRTATELRLGISASEGALIGYWQIDPDALPLKNPEGLAPLLNAVEDDSYTNSHGGPMFLLGTFATKNQIQTTDDSEDGDGNNSLNADAFATADTKLASLVQIRGSCVDPGPEKTRCPTYTSIPVSILYSTGDESEPNIGLMPDNGVLLGAFDDIFRMWGNSPDPYKVSVINVATEKEAIEGTDLCLHPWLRLGRISTAFDEESFTLPDASANCRVAVKVSARSLNGDVVNTPDMAFAICDENNDCIEYDDSPEGSVDPLVYLDANDVANREIRLRSHLGTVGFYTVNVRPASVIQRVSLEEGNGIYKFVELQMEPGTDAGGCVLETVDPNPSDTEIHEPWIETFRDGFVVPDDGRVFVASGDAPFVTIPTGADNEFPVSVGDDFKLVFSCSSGATDILQVGGEYKPTIQSVDTGGASITDTSKEGAPMNNVSALCYHRIGAGIDTNRNYRDFAPATRCEAPTSSP